MIPPKTSGYVCDTLPTPRLAGADRAIEELGAAAEGAAEQPTRFELPALAADGEGLLEEEAVSMEEVDNTPTGPSVAVRKLCVRHQRMADEGTNLKMQHSLDALPVAEREAVNAIWSSFSASSHPRRALILQGLLTMCCFSQLSLLTELLSHLIRIDPFVVLPNEIAFKILGYLDATSLCRAAQVNKLWKKLADDDVLWRGICEQHIGQKCRKCGWGLPILERRRTARRSASPSHLPISIPQSRKREFQEPESSNSNKRHCSQPGSSSNSRAASSSWPPSRSGSSAPTTSMSSIHIADPANALASSSRLPDSVTRPWKDVYSERLTVERNWRRGRYTLRTLKGHTDGVLCLQFDETLDHPSFPVLITGSYDKTARVWNLETGQEMMVMRGHTRAVRCLQFDAAKLITGSMDTTIRVWNWRTGKCIRTLEGHTEGVVCLNFDSNVLASGSVDASIKVWNFRTGEAFTLRGHCDWVNAVQLWDCRGNVAAPSCAVNIADTPSCPEGSAPHIDPGKMLFSASDDGTIRLWNLTTRACVRVFSGHVGQVQSMKLLLTDETCDDDADAKAQQKSQGGSPAPTPAGAKRAPVLISGSLDNTIKLWDIATGRTATTLFGHIEGVWAVASDQLRLVSGSHDRTIKVWSRDEGRCLATLVGHRGAVTCLGLAEDKIVSGSDDGEVRIWSFLG